MYVTDRPLRIELRPQGQALLCRMSGSATMEVCYRLVDKLGEAVQTEPRLLVIDLSDLEFIGSLGLGGIVAAYICAQRYDGKVVVASPAPAVRGLFEVTRLETLIPVFDTTAEALLA